MNPFTESMRYEYNLTPDDLVWDVGGYEGNFARAIATRYRCSVTCFEPVFFERVRLALVGLEKVRVVPYALSDAEGAVTMRMKGDSSGAFADSGPVVEAVTVDVAKHLPDALALLKLNIEGGEFAVLERILATELAARVRDIQVQFHPIVPDYQARYEAIAAGLSKTHELTYHAPWCWENWRRKS